MPKYFKHVGRGNRTQVKEKIKNHTYFINNTQIDAKISEKKKNQESNAVAQSDSSNISFEIGRKYV